MVAEISDEYLKLIQIWGETGEQLVWFCPTVGLKVIP